MNLRGLQIKERRERKLASNSEDGRSQMSKATTSRFLFSSMEIFSLQVLCANSLYSFQFSE